jgi:hypothetical protein
MTPNLLYVQCNRLSSVYRKLKQRFDRAIKENRFKDYSMRKQRQLISRLEKMRLRLASLENMLKFSGMTMALGFMISTGEAQAQPPVIGSEFKVSTYSTGNQSKSAIAMDKDGDFVVTWNSGDSQDGQYYGVFAQRYNASGVAQGSEFQVNTYTTSHQSNPAIAMDSAGNFVVAWQSYQQDGYAWGIYAQRYDAAGVAQGSEFQVHTQTTGFQANAAIAMDTAGNFVVTWQSNQDGSSWGVYAQRYDASGTPQGGEFQVNTTTTYAQSNPAAAMDSEGDFVISWQSYQDGDGYGIYAQRYDASGAPQGSEFQVNSFTTDYQIASSVAMDTAGNFVVTWESYYQDGDGYGIYAQRYDVSGIAQGSEFQVNTYTTSNQTNPSIAMDSDGDFVVTWSSGGSQDGYNYGIYAQHYNASGVAQGEFLVNTYTTLDQTIPVIAIDGKGDFAIVWSSEFQDLDLNGIYAQRYTIANLAPTDIALSASSVDENVAANTTVGTFSSTDLNAGNTFTYSLVSGTGSTDNASFSISGSDLLINSSPDFETKSSYNIRIRTTDQGSLTFEKEFTITINDLNEAPTDIALSASSVNENVTANTTVGAFSTTDPDASNTFTYTLVSGTGSTDNASFNISGSNLRITNSPNFETKNSYSIRVRSTDQGGSLNFEKEFTITINDVNEAPSDIALSVSSVDENVAANTTVGALSSTDPDPSNTFTYTLVSGTGSTDNASFNISGSNLRITNSPDFETKNSYSIRVRSTDQGSLTFDKVFTITINNVNEAPVISSQTFSVDENSAVGTAVGTVVASDVDASQTLTYAITAGNTGGVFAINSTTGAITVATATLDFETTPSYSLTVEVTDNNGTPLSSSATVTININDVTETGLANALANSAINIYPNPSLGEIDIQANGLSLEGSNLTLFTAAGSIVYTGKYSKHLSLTHLSKGIYTLKIENEKTIFVKQIVIQ